MVQAGEPSGVDDRGAVRRLPEAIEVRELRYETSRPGFRTRCVTLVTTLLDPQAYPPEALAEL